MSKFVYSNTNNKSVDYFKASLANFFFLIWRNKFIIKSKNKIKDEINFIFTQLFFEGKLTLVQKFDSVDNDYYLYPFILESYIHPLVNPLNINLTIPNLANAFAIVPPDKALVAKYPFIFIRSNQESPFSLIEGELNELAYLFAIIRANSFNLLNKKYYFTNETDKKIIETLEKLQLMDTNPIAFVTYMKAIETLNPGKLNENMKINNNISTTDIFFSIQKLYSSCKTKIGIFSMDSQKVGANETDNQVAMNQFEANLITDDEITTFNYYSKKIGDIVEKYRDFRIIPKNFENIIKKGKEILDRKNIEQNESNNDQENKI